MLPSGPVAPPLQNGGPLSVEVRNDERARGGPLTSKQAQHIAIMTALGGVIGLAVGFAVGKRRG